jgi:Fur family peroxide stress response transcriptional regulator
MHQKDINNHFLRLQDRCRERGIPVTPQRRAVFEALLDSRDHPTAERLHEAVSRRFSGVSLATVYRALELLVDLGLVRRTCSPGSRCRYEARILRHHHLVCEVCERMVDYDNASLNRLSFPDSKLTGFRVEDYSIHFRGICAGCLRKQGRSRRKEDHHS